MNLKEIAEKIVFHQAYGQYATDEALAIYLLDVRTNVHSRYISRVDEIVSALRKVRDEAIEICCKRIDEENDIGEGIYTNLSAELRKLKEGRG